MTNRATSRQLKGQFDALRASISHSSLQAIDIAGGNYGTGKTYQGVVGISHSSWESATGVFYVFLDESDELVLDNTSGFPELSTKIARVEVVAGTIIDVHDERAVVNGLVDGYYVLYDDTNALVVAGDTVQQALDSLDAYVANNIGTGATGQDIDKYRDFDIMGGVPNGLVKICQISDTPAIEYPRYESGTARNRFTASVPADYVSGTNIIIRVYWSPGTVDTGDVHWRLRYRTPLSNSDNIDSALTTLSYVQAAPGTSNRLTDTGTNLFIDSSVIQAGDILIFNIEREYDGSDTYDSSARLHLIRIEYTGRGIT